MKKLMIILALLGASLIWFAKEQQASRPSDLARITSIGDERLAAAFADRRKNLAAHGQGTVIRLLPDETNGIKHQRFILRLASGQTLLVAHNISVANRIDFLQVGDAVEFMGVYEWNPEGGVIHWTHHDPQGAHAPGWLKHKNKTYQ